MLFAKPDIGINVPAPPNLAILSKTPKAVSKIVIVIKITLIHEPTRKMSIFGLKALIISPNICPKQQISPPTIKAWKSEPNQPVLGVRFSTYKRYSSFRAFEFFFISNLHFPQNYLNLFTKTYQFIQFINNFLNFEKNNIRKWRIIWKEK